VAPCYSRGPVSKDPEAVDPILQALDELIEGLDALRVEAARLKRLTTERLELRHMFDDKTPVEVPGRDPKRSSSQSAFEAFRASSDMLKKKPPP